MKRITESSLVKPTLVSQFLRRPIMLQLRSSWKVHAAEIVVSR